LKKENDRGYKQDGLRERFWREDDINHNLLPQSAPETITERSRGASKFSIDHRRQEEGDLGGIFIKSLKVRIYPDEEQRTLIEKHFGSTRFVWNYFLRKRKEYYDNGKSMSKFDTMDALRNLKKEYVWLSEVNSQSLQQSLIKLDIAFKAFFKHNSSYPAFRSKKDNQYFIVPQSFSFKEQGIQLPKFRRAIRFKDKSPIPEKVKQVIITRDVDRYYASIQYESDEKPSKGGGVMGIDLGVKHFLTTSDGLQVEPLNITRKMEKKLKKEHRRLSRKKKGSANRKKQITKVRKIYQHIRDARTDFNHKVSTAIAKHNGIVVIEDLNIQGMVQNHHIAKSIIDQGWYQFKQMLQYKLQWRNANLVEIGRFDPSSKLCSNCGNIKHDLKLSDRVYHCDVCGLTMDRDINAAINIRNIGLIKIGQGMPEFTPVESATTAELLKGGLRLATL
jgi:putative transposase